MNYAEALSFLSGLRRFGLRPGLATTERLAELAGRPQDRLRFLHVAGTNGKGSTCAFLESIYRTAGYRVGLYTSPHLVTCRERIQVNRELISERDLARLAGEAATWAADLPPDSAASFFEVVTVIALRWFAEQACDVVVWETGLGGRLDSTNIVNPLASLITNIGWDHQQWLGETLEAIAREKAGIIKPGVPVLTTATEPGPLEVIRRRAAEVGAPLTEVDPSQPEWGPVGTVRLALAGGHQVANAALATAAVGILQPRLPVEVSVLCRGLESTRWAGRFEEIRDGDRTLVLDGAHNRPAFAALAATLAERFPGRRYALVLGMLADKDLAGAARVLVPGAGRVVVVPVHTGRAAPPGEVVRQCRAAGGTAPVVEADGVKEALAGLADESLVVVTGSLYLVGEALEAILPGTTSERDLNDWGPTR